MKKTIAIIGSHGIYASYGGWDQLVNNLAERKSDETLDYLIFNSKESANIKQTLPKGVTVKFINLNASGFQGLFYDFWSILISYFRVDGLLLLGVQGMPLLLILRLFLKKSIVSNVGGIEWERPKFSFLAKLYLKLCFYLSFLLSKHVILDNEYYLKFAPKHNRNKISVIPYGGTIDDSLDINKDLLKKYPFLHQDYFLSISRALKDNFIDELCQTFAHVKQRLVLISNFSSSEYGKSVLQKYSNHQNIVLIDGLYNKAELDLVRRSCKAYIHTHTLCGTAPSLVEMIMSRRPVISIDVPQNKFTLANSGLFFKDFEQLLRFLSETTDFSSYVPIEELTTKYNWNNIVNQYQKLF